MATLPASSFLYALGSKIFKIYNINVKKDNWQKEKLDWREELKGKSKSDPITIDAEITPVFPSTPSGTPASSPIKREAGIIKPRINLAHDKLEEAKAKKELENMPAEEREKIGWGLSTIGFKVEKAKNDLFANTFGLLLEEFDGKGTMGRFCRELSDSFARDAEEARKKGVAIQKGEDKARLRNFGLFWGNLLKHGRIITDLTGASLASPLRYVMMAGATMARFAGSAKEARLKNEEVIEKTRIQDAEKAEEEAWKIYDEAEKESKARGESEVSAENLKRAYLISIPADLQERLRDPSVASTFIQKILRSEITSAISKLDNTIQTIEGNTKLSEQQKRELKEKLITKQKKRLEDYDRIVTQYGTVDQLAMAGRYAQTVGKTVVTAMTVETLALSVEKIWETVSDILHDHNFTFGTGVIKHAAFADEQELTGRQLKQWHDFNQDRMVQYAETSTQSEAEIPEAYPTPEQEPTPVPTSAPEPTPEPEATQTPETGNTPETEVPEQTVPGTEIEAKAPETVIKFNPEAVVGKGEGIEHALRRQIEDPEWAQKLGFKGDINNPEELHEFSGKMAHRIALDKGYVDSTTGEEIRVKTEGTIAYQLYDAGDGKIGVEEVQLNDKSLIEEIKIREQHGPGTEFEGEQKEEYEYKYTPQAKPIEHETPVVAEAETGSANVEEITLKPQGEYASIVEPSSETVPPEPTQKPAITLEETKIRAKLKEQYEASESSKTDKSHLAGESFGAGKAFGTGRVVGTGGRYYDDFYRPHNYPYYFHDLTDRENFELNINPEFAHNPFNLDNKTLWDVYEFFQHHMERLLPGDQGLEDWEEVRDISAVKFLRDSGYQNDKIYQPLTKYVRDLMEETGLKPKSWSPFHPAETTKAFIARALQKAAEKGILEKVMM